MPRYRADGGRTDSVFKWVLRVTSVLTLVFALVQAMRLVSDVRDRRRQIDELMRVQQLQVQSNDYAGAWATFEQALKIAESGGQLAKLTGQVSADVQRVRVAQEDFAMVWVENLTAPSAEKYTSLVAQLTPVMTRGAASATGVRKADLQAHIGWSAINVSVLTFANAREPGPEAPCRAALTDDPANPYAHACLGYWMLWAGRPIDEGMREFSSALAANRSRPFVRLAERAALKRRGQDAEPALVALANDMRKNGEPVPTALRSDLYNIYYSLCGSREDADGLRALTTAVPAAEQAATYQALVIDSPQRDGDMPRTASHHACLGTLLENAGDRDHALAAWRRVRDALGSRNDSVLAPRADAAIRRLSQK